MKESKNLAQREIQNASISSKLNYLFNMKMTNIVGKNDFEEWGNFEDKIKSIAPHIYQKSIGIAKKTPTRRLGENPNPSKVSPKDPFFHPSALVEKTVNVLEMTKTKNIHF
jgi:hypothetical protein